MDKYDKMTNETLNKAYADFLEGLKKEANKKKSYDYDLTVSDKTSMDKEYVIPMDLGTYKLGTSTRYYGDYIDNKTIINGYEIKPELMDKIKSFDDFNVFLENCKNNVIEETNRQKTASVLSRTIATNYDVKEIKLLVEYLQEMLKKESN
jgi:hypothetical protein